MAYEHKRPAPFAAHLPAANRKRSANAMYPQMVIKYNDKTARWNLVASQDGGTGDSTEWGTNSPGIIRIMQHVALEHQNPLKWIPNLDRDDDLDKCVVGNAACVRADLERIIARSIPCKTVVCQFHFYGIAPWFNVAAHAWILHQHLPQPTADVPYVCAVVQPQRQDGKPSERVRDSTLYLVPFHLIKGESRIVFNHSLLNLIIEARKSRQWIHDRSKSVQSWHDPLPGVYRYKPSNAVFMRNPPTIHVYTEIHLIREEKRVVLRIAKRVRLI
jgi:hypothetical protein